MLPVSVSDILKLLEQIPIWKAVAGLPKRVAELERKVAALEAAAKGGAQRPTGRECPVCGAEMRVTAETPDPTFGVLGVKLHSLKCGECGTAAQRQFEPGKGYA